MLEEEYAEILQKFNDRQVEIEKKRQKIKRWLAYRHKKLPNLSKSKDSLPDTDDPAVIMLARLTGSSLSKPRVPIAYNMWGRFNKQKINDAYTNAHIYKPLPKNLQAAERTRITKNLFDALPLPERKKYIEMAKKEGDEKLKVWKEKLSSAPSTDPEDRQRCIAALPIFMQPILDLVHGHTNMQATFMVGGPEPADGGRLNIISMHAGSVKGPVQMNFGQAEREGFQGVVTPLFGRYLRKCYTKSECRAQALPSSDPNSLLNLLNGNQITVHRADWDMDDPLALGLASNVSALKTPSLPPSREHTPALDSPAQDESPPSTPPPAVSLLERSVPVPSSPFPSERAASPPPSPISSPPLPVASETAVVVEDNAIAGKKRKKGASVGAAAAGDHERSASVKKRRGALLDQTTTVKGGKKSKSGVKAGARGSNPVPVGKELTVGLSSTPSDPSIRPSAINVESSTSLLPTHTTSSPAWFGPCSTMLRSKDLGPEWLKMVGLWEAFERRHDFKPTNKQPNLSSSKRPPCIGEWLKNARRSSWRPLVENAVKFDKDFDADFGAWWGGLLRAQSVTSVRDWSPIAKPGVNGLLSVVAALFFWGDSCGPTSAWRKHMGEVVEAFKALVSE
ncbi:uncharacterized protein LACBIDRAFT_331239 [Laccaria bicolor S238N-H82]|uniref:Predicted protein n=1 Tax=Laccaria bicolor (strain S238N-H82 / ATCC MYA-4686) TaxID=486041 RepID=B0DNW3_LACBS|nr:uncharacterized protein LACBIDRAFT_331239 [Laccaria bicolor S238N-H82]EDR03724.1 predicted protein [Laccaria bicolor S238N-H82]|eukprot:XP_001885577.1 predicted protein [Laccaria bicolor S238N-H82]